MPRQGRGLPPRPPHPHFSQLVGVGGSKTGAGVTGDVASGCFLTQQGSFAATIVATKIAGVSGYDSDGADAQQIAISNVTVAGQVDFSAVLTASSGPVGSQVVVEFEIEIVSTTLPSGLGLALKGTGSGVTLSGELVNLYDLTDGEKYFCRTAPATLNSSGTFQAVLSVSAGVGSEVTLKILNPTIRLV